MADSVEFTNSIQIPEYTNAITRFFDEYMALYNIIGSYNSGTNPKSTDAYANLTESERKLLRMLQKDSIHSRLEQEKIPVAYVNDAISGLDTSNIKKRTSS